MGQARTRALRTVAAAAAGEPIVIELGERSARRLAALRAAAEGAAIVVNAATQQHKALQEKYEEAVAGVLEANRLDLDQSTPVEIAHDADRGTLTVTPKGAPAAAPAGPAPDPTVRPSEAMAAAAAAGG